MAAKKVSKAVHARRMVEAAVESNEQVSTWAMLSTLWPCADHIMTRWARYISDRMDISGRNVFAESVEDALNKVQNVYDDGGCQHGDRTYIYEFAKTIREHSDEIRKVQAEHPDKPAQKWSPSDGPIIDWWDCDEFEPKFSEKSRGLSAQDMQEQINEHVFEPFVLRLLRDGV